MSLMKEGFLEEVTCKPSCKCREEGWTCQEEGVTQAWEVEWERSWRRQERKCGPRSEGTERRLAGPFGSDKEAMESLLERGDSSAMKKQGSHPGSPGRKRLFRFSFHLTPSWNTPLLHSLWAVRGHLLRNVDVLAQSFPNIWLACLLSFQPLNWDYKQWNEKLINAFFFFRLKKNLIIMILQPGPCLAIVLNELCSPLSDKTSQPSHHSQWKIDCRRCEVQGEFSVERKM